MNTALDSRTQSGDRASCECPSLEGLTFEDRRVKPSQGSAIEHALGNKMVHPHIFEENPEQPPVTARSVIKTVADVGLIAAPIVLGAAVAVGNVPLAIGAAAVIALCLTARSWVRRQERRDNLEPPAGPRVNIR